MMTTKGRLPALVLSFAAIASGAAGLPGCDLNEPFEGEFNAGGVDPFNFLSLRELRLKEAP